MTSSDGLSSIFQQLSESKVKRLSQRGATNAATSTSSTTTSTNTNQRSGAGGASGGATVSMTPISERPSMADRQRKSDYGGKGGSSSASASKLLSGGVSSSSSTSSSFWNRKSKASAAKSGGGGGSAPRRQNSKESARARSGSRGSASAEPLTPSNQPIPRVIGANYPPLYGLDGGTGSSVAPVDVVLPDALAELTAARSHSTSPGHGMEAANALVDRTSSPPLAQRPSSTGSNGTLGRQEKFERLLEAQNVDIMAMKKLAWKGVPPPIRGQVWRVLLEYLPSNSHRRADALERKRKEYFDCFPRYIYVPDDDRTSSEQKMWRQIEIDMPRTHPSLRLFQDTDVHRRLHRLIYIWALRHPASGYVQGINDLATPFFVVFLAEHERCELEDVFQYEALAKRVDAAALDRIEADTYWCMSKLLDGIQDHYTFAQPGIQRMIFKLQELVHRVDEPLFLHLEAQHAMFIQFAFRWMNNLLLRELPLEHVVRMWDTYLSDDRGLGFAAFHAYVCAALLQRFSAQLRQLEFQEIILFVQNLPDQTRDWTENDIEMLLSQAYMWFVLFDGAQAHLKPAADNREEQGFSF